MYEHFQLHVWAFLADLFDLVQRQLAREDDALHAHLLPELDGGVVGGVGLHREVNHGLGPLFLDHHDQAGVGHDQRVGLHLDDGLDVAQVGADLVVVGNDVGRQEKLLATLVGFLDALCNLLHAELVVAGTQGVAGLAGIDSVGAKVIGGAHLV